LGQIDNLKAENYINNNMNNSNDRYYLNESKIKKEYKDSISNEDGLLDVGSLQNKLLDLKNQRKNVL